MAKSHIENNFANVHSVQLLYLNMKRSDFEQGCTSSISVLAKR